MDWPVSPDAPTMATLIVDIWEVVGCVLIEMVV
jgi:hypothetical protein